MRGRTSARREHGGWRPHTCEPSRDRLAVRFIPFLSSAAIREESLGRGRMTIARRGAAGSSSVYSRFPMGRTATSSRCAWSAATRRGGRIGGAVIDMGTFAPRRCPDRHQCAAEAMSLVSIAHPRLIPSTTCRKVRDAQNDRGNSKRARFVVPRRSSATIPPRPVTAKAAKYEGAARSASCVWRTTRHNELQQATSPVISATRRHASRNRPTAIPQGAAPVKKNGQRTRNLSTPWRAAIHSREFPAPPCV